LECDAYHQVRHASRRDKDIKMRGSSPGRSRNVQYECVWHGSGHHEIRVIISCGEPVLVGFPEVLKSNVVAAATGRVEPISRRSNHHI